jgi:hypothetical protein
LGSFRVMSGIFFLVNHCIGFDCFCSGSVQ